MYGRGICQVWGENKCIVLWLVKVKGKEYLADIHVNGRIILKRILKTRIVGTNFAGATNGGML
jgi:hypothetical protein